MSNYELPFRGGVVSSLLNQENDTVDYIVEQGSTDDWIYRKWNSGIAECWRVREYTVVTDWGGSSNFSGFYYPHSSSSWISVKYPFTFSSIPHETVQFLGEKTQRFTECFVTCYKRNTTEYSGEYVPYRASADSASNLVLCYSMHVIGKWK